MIEVDSKTVFCPLSLKVFFSTSVFLISVFAFAPLASAKPLVCEANGRHCHDAEKCSSTRWQSRDGNWHDIPKGGVCHTNVLGRDPSLTDKIYSSAIKNNTLVKCPVGSTKQTDGTCLTVNKFDSKRSLLTRKNSAKVSAPIKGK